MYVYVCVRFFVMCAAGKAVSVAVWKAPSVSVKGNFKADRGLVCAWTFVKYHPSPVEASWTSNIVYNQQHVCEATHALPAADIATWIEYAKWTQSPLPNQADCGPPPAPVQPSSDGDAHSMAVYNVLSSFEYIWQCVSGDGEVQAPVGSPTSTFVLIEPLAGPLRHPRMCDAGEEEAFALDRNYLVFDAWATVHAGALQMVDIAGVTHLERRNALYFDVGASTFNQGYGGPSQGYFLQWIRQQCLNITDIYAWEAKAVPSEDVWAQVPGELQSTSRWWCRVVLVLVLTVTHNIVRVGCWCHGHGLV